MTGPMTRAHLGHGISVDSFVIVELERVFGIHKRSILRPEVPMKWSTGTVRIKDNDA